MKPTVGRIVHYYPQDGDRFGTMDEPIAAVIVRVWSEECVNLRLLPDSDDSPHVSSVPLDENCGAYSWSWPPRA